MQASGGSMITVTVNGQTYTRWFAWLPRRVTSGELVWWELYYMRPNQNGEGILLSKDEWILEIGRA